MNWFDVGAFWNIFSNDAKMFLIFSRFFCWQWKPESIKIHFEYPSFFRVASCKKLLYVHTSCCKFPIHFAILWAIPPLVDRWNEEEIMIFPFRINRVFFILTFWNVNVHKTDEREMLANVISMENKQNLLRSVRHSLAQQKKQPHKPKQSILMHMSVCFIDFEWKSLEMLFLVIFYTGWVTVSTLYLLLICTHSMQFRIQFFNT